MIIVGNKVAISNDVYRKFIKHHYIVSEYVYYGLYDQ